MTAANPWTADCAEWAAILAARNGQSRNASLSANPLWPLYAPMATAVNSHFVIGQIGQSLDGRIATAAGQSHYINGRAALLHLHRLRALADAVVVGVGTVLADDPRLTVRGIAGASPARVIIDPRGRLPPTARCLTEDNARRVVIGARASVPGVEYLDVPASDGVTAPAAIVRALSKAGLRRILIEGGPTTLSRFVAARALDRLHVLIGPLMIGSGMMGLALPPISNLDEAIKPSVTYFPLPGGDLICDCDMRG